jgi:hypothetical protein
MIVIGLCNSFVSHSNGVRPRSVRCGVEGIRIIIRDADSSVRMELVFVVLKVALALMLAVPAAADGEAALLSLHHRGKGSVSMCAVMIWRNGGGCNTVFLSLSLALSPSLPPPYPSHPSHKYVPMHSLARRTHAHAHPDAMPKPSHVTRYPPTHTPSVPADSLAPPPTHTHTHHADLVHS